MGKKVEKHVSLLQILTLGMKILDDFQMCSTKFTFLAAFEENSHFNPIIFLILRMKKLSLGSEATSSPRPLRPQIRGRGSPNFYPEHICLVCWSWIQCFLNSGSHSQAMCGLDFSALPIPPLSFQKCPNPSLNCFTRNRFLFMLDANHAAECQNSCRTRKCSKDRLFCSTQSDQD